MTDPSTNVRSAVVDPTQVGAMPVDLVLDPTEAILVAACGHWWQSPIVTGAIADREARPVIWAPLAHCRECERVQLVMQLLEAIRLQVQAASPDGRKLGYNLATLLDALEPGDLPELRDGLVTAVVALTEYMPGETNPRTDHLAACRKAPGCPWATGHPGPCPGAPADDSGPRPGRWAGRLAYVKDPGTGELYVFPATVIPTIAGCVAGDPDMITVTRLHGPDLYAGLPEPAVPPADREDAARPGHIRTDGPAARMGLELINGPVIPAAEPTEAMVTDWAIHNDHTDGLVSDHVD